MILQNAKKLLRAYSLVFFAMLCGMMVCAQQPQPPKEKESNYVDFTGFKGKIFELKNRDPHDLISILSPLGSGFKGATIQANSEMKTLTVRDFPENIAVIEEAIKRLDVSKPAEAARKSSPDVELRLHVLIASNIEGATNSFPIELNEVIKQLQTTINYKNYFLLTSVFQRAATFNSVYADGTITLGKPFFDKTIDGQYDLLIRGFNMNFAAPAIQISGFNFGFQANDAALGHAKIQTNLTIKDGEKLVVGTASLKDKALVLVLSVKVIK